jgi:hypothetical protein
VHAPRATNGGGPAVDTPHDTVDAHGRV